MRNDHLPTKTQYPSLRQSVGRSVISGFAFFMTVAGLSIAYAAYTALSDVTSSDKLTVGMWTQLKDNFMNHETRIGTLETGKEVSATFLAGPSNMATVTANNGGYVLFDSVAQNSDPSVFEVITTGSYGIRFKKAGRIVWNYQQDARTSSNVGYVQAYAYIDGSDVVRSLMGPTNTLWDGMHNHGVYNVAAWQTLTFNVSCSSCTLTGLDNGVWGRIGILWIGKP